jgi:hypothetical protein
MNEQIFKLALKAIDFQGAVDIDTELKLTNSELAKFAELIVKKCAAIASNTNLEDVDGGDSAVLGAAREQILEHFGVEE